ncbi:MAG: hypothetical protein J5835_02975 [Bacteroidales bacterium]|nr:hypothetical protein [Bacteroidales bacterium]
MRKTKLFVLLPALLFAFFSCTEKELPEGGDTTPEETTDPEENTDPEQSEDPDKEPVWPSDASWPVDPDAFDYDILESRQAHMPPMATYPSFPISYDKVYYGSAITYGSSGDKFVMQKSASADYSSAKSSGRYISIKVSSPGTLSFVPRLTGEDKIATVYVTLAITKNGVPESYKTVLAKQLTGWTTSGNYDVLKAYRVYAPVSESDLAGITESATLYIYCTDAPIIIYPLKWASAHTNMSFDVDAAAAALREKVLSAPNTVDRSSVSGKCYYVSNAGKDSNDGLSSARPIQTIAKLNSLDLKPGDAVLFRRGDTWRRDPTKLSWQAMISTKPGVTYSAYGTGEKPKILGSPWNAAKEGTWTLTDKANVYVFDDATFGTGAVGGVLLDGESGPMISPGYGLHDLTYKSLSKDKTCIQDGGKFYLCSTAGNPSTRWKDIEIFVAGHTIKPMGDCVIDNLCIRYCASHGIGTGTNLNLNLTVTNCEISYIGGAYNHAGQSDQVRYGNAIQLWGGCESFVVENNWIYQCFDTGITHQYSDKNNDDCLMLNIKYCGNLVEYCYYSIEWFLNSLEGHERIMRNVLIDRNICRWAGLAGWNVSRGEDSTHPMRHLQSWLSDNPAENFVISNNIFDRSTWPEEMFTVYARKAESQPLTHNNFYIK